jgi:type II secretory pathway pseudopilin PulG
MKTSHPFSLPKGLTLLEVTVVILVLLTFISILFVGARAWKRGADRAANVTNIRNAQQAVRGHQNLHNLPTGVPLTEAMIYGALGTSRYLTKPEPPTSAIVSYAGLGTVPPIGDLWLQASYQDPLAESAYGMDGIDTSEW